MMRTRGNCLQRAVELEFGTVLNIMRASNIKSITYMKTHAAELVNAVNETRSPIVITQNGETRAVVMDSISYDQMRGALILLKILFQSDVEYRKGNWKSQEDVEAELEKRFPRRARRAR